MAMDRRSFNRRLMAGGAVAATGVTSLSVASASSAAPAPMAAEAGPKRAPAGGKVHHLTMVAERLGTGKIGYGFEKGKASIPGPLIDIVEGDTVHIEFTNLTDVDASLHVHGVDYDIANDGTRMNKSHVEPGGTRTYTWRTHRPGKRADGTYREGSAGYWHYHDHVVGTDHGTGGIRQGCTADWWSAGRVTSCPTSSSRSSSTTCRSTICRAPRAPTSRPPWVNGSKSS